MSLSQNLYFKWLCTKIPCESDREIEECWHLFVKVFYCFIDNDLNRLQDGLVLRDNFLEETGVKADVGGTDSPMACTMLEMLIALARRLTFMNEDSRIEDNTVRRWFFEMLDNLGKERARRAWDDYRWDDALEKVLTRTYKSDGTGGLFPRLPPVEDQRQVEIWKQANGYLLDWYS